VAKPSPFTPLSSLELGTLFALWSGRRAQRRRGQRRGGCLDDRRSARAEDLLHGGAPHRQEDHAGGRRGPEAGDARAGREDPAVVLPDWSIDRLRSPSGCSGGRSRTSGQICVAIKRLYVHETVYQPIVAALTELAGRVTMGAGLEAGASSDRSTTGHSSNGSRSWSTMRGGRAGRWSRAAARSLAPGTSTPDPRHRCRRGVRLVDEEQFAPRSPSSPTATWTMPSARQTDPLWPRRLGLDRRCGTGAGTGAAPGVRDAWVNQHINTVRWLPRGHEVERIGRENGRWGLDEFSDLQVLSARL